MNFLKKIFGLLLSFLFLSFYGQNSSDKTLYCPYSEFPPQPDGDISDSVWKKSFAVSSFFQQYPYDTSLAQYQSTVMALSTKQALYIAARIQSVPNKKPVVQNLKRDFSYPVNDAFVVTIDPFMDGQNGFSFGVNPYGSQREGLVQSGGGMGVTTIWDNIWYAQTKRYDSVWTVEMKIPFKSIRFNKGTSLWKINFSVNNLNANESSNWFRVPRQFNNSTLAYMGFLQFEKQPHTQGKNLAFIPYVILRNYYPFSSAENTQYTFNGGSDIKWTLNNSMNLDLTFNPDFSQVEADRQILNLTRFSVFFPEQRQFFLENSDLFERFGFRQIRPFFSRRIGLQNGEIIPILFGARLSGKPSQRWRVGIMNVQTTEKILANQQKYFPENFSVAAFQYNVFARSNIAGIFVNKQRTDTSGVYNRVIGIDYNLASKDNRWMGKVFFHHSLSPSGNDNAYAHASWITYQDMNWNISWNHEYVDKNYRAETGFTPRIFQTDESGKINRFTYWRWEPNFYRSFYPKSKTINRIQTGIYADVYFNQNLKNTDQYYRTFIDINGQKTWAISLAHHYYYTHLFFPTDISFSGAGLVIPAGDYYYQQASFRISGDQRKDIIPSAQIQYGFYYTGIKLSQTYDITFRIRPYVLFQTSYNLEKIQMPGQKSVILQLFNPRIEFTFTRNLFLTFFWQYNTQLHNINLNARLQWRFRPMCDFFLVWIDNYNDQRISVLNRAIIGKIVVWINT